MTGKTNLTASVAARWTGASGSLAAGRSMVASAANGGAMTTAPRPSREIDGKGRTIRELLAGRKYSIDYDQREYKNLLARSLHERAYDHNPGLRRFIEASGLPLCAHAEFRKADLDARQVLYQRLAERIWSPERLDEEAAS